MADLSKGVDKLAERYVKHGDPRKPEGAPRPTSQEAHDHAAKTARDVEKKKQG